MFKKVLICFCLLSSFVLAQDVIQIGIKYNEASARIEAFDGIIKKIDKDFYRDFLVDKNKEENIKNIKSGNFKLMGRELCPFYIKNTLATYAVSYDDMPFTTFYYNILGKLIKFDIMQNQTYPIKTYGYSRYGNLISVGFDVDDREQFVYDENGKLKAHWIDDEALNKDNGSFKVFKIKRGLK